MIDVYVHIDKKWKISDKDLNLITSVGAVVIPKRISCYLDEWSLVEASLQLISEAKKKYDYDYYILLSGQDYPIKPINSIVDVLSNNYPRPYIDVTPYDKTNWVYYKFRYTPLHQSILKLTNRVQSILKRRIRGAKKLRNSIDKYVPRRYELFPRLKSLNVSLYGGSAWWILPNVAINEIMEDMGKNPNIVDLFKKTQTPEETFFQTLIMRTSCAKNVEINPIWERKQNCMTYANFETPTKKFVGHPHTLVAEDWKWLKLRKEFFARKFDIQVDEEIFYVIDKDNMDKD